MNDSRRELETFVDAVKIAADAFLEGFIKGFQGIVLRINAFSDVFFTPEEKARIARKERHRRRYYRRYTRGVKK
jgi:hypothetical protein